MLNFTQHRKSMIIPANKKRIVDAFKRKLSRLAEFIQAVYREEECSENISLRFVTSETVADPGLWVAVYLALEGLANDHGFAFEECSLGYDIKIGDEPRGIVTITNSSGRRGHIFIDISFTKT